MSDGSTLFAFPDPVNETSARVVAAGVVTMATGAIVLDQPWLMLPLTYGFAARVATGPTLSPLGQLATRVVTPRLPVRHRFAPGAPKRLAQGMGLVMSGTALALHASGRPRAAKGVLGVLVAAAGAEASLGFCVACRLFPLLMRAGLVPEATCVRCADLSRARRPAAAGPARH